MVRAVNAGLDMVYCMANVAVCGQQSTVCLALYVARAGPRVMPLISLS